MWYIIDNRGGSLNGDTLDKIDEAIKKLQNNEVSTEVEVIKEDTDTKIFDGNSNLENTMEFNGIVEERPREIVITVLLVTAFILFLY